MTTAPAHPQTDGFQLIEHTWIPLPDGCRLAARIWLPGQAHDAPAPAILEYLPYRLRDGTALRDGGVHPYFATHGYASVRVDIRGTGDSEGIFDDEYSPQEHADALAVIDWIARQPWCDGNVGMMGISWGGFNSLQVAALRPPALKAIVTVCSTDDRYNDDCHYQGGCVIGDDMLPWAASLLAIVATPPDLSVRTDTTDFLQAWKSRIDSLEPPAHLWLAHQTQDEYWRHGSVCEDYSAVEAATLVVGGWADGYRNAAVRLLENLTCPRRGIIGPWAHRYPHIGSPQPAIDFLQECLRWWDYWLRDRESGAMDPPLLRTWVHDWDDPTPQRSARSGRWVGLEAWKDQRNETFLLGNGQLVGGNSPGGAVVVASRQDTGLETGAWCAYGRPGDFAPDQRLMDGGWVTFDGAVLSEPLAVFGFPELVATLASSRPEANLCVRLCDVAPDGTSLLVSEGVLNLTHHRGHDAPERLAPGVPVEVTVRLNALAHRFAAGHRVRLALSPTYFPRVWPSPEEVVLTLDAGESSRLTLPILPEATDHVEFHGPPEASFGLAVETLQQSSYHREVTRRFHDREEAQLTVVSDGGLDLIAGRVLHGSGGHDRFRINPDDPLSAEVECKRSVTVGRPGNPARVEVLTTLTADAEAFHVQTDVQAYLDTELVHQRALHKRIPRHPL